MLYLVKSAPISCLMLTMDQSMCLIPDFYGGGVSAVFVVKKQQKSN